MHWASWHGEKRWFNMFTQGLHAKPEVTAILRAPSGP
jgi:hypothetical protein